MAMADRQPGAAELFRWMTERRSAREGFDGRPIERSDLEYIVDCGRRAPSSKNAQPWRFHVVVDRPTLAAIAEDVVRANDEAADAFVPLDPTTGTAHRTWSPTVVESADVVRQVPAAIFIENRGEFSRGRRAVAEAPDVTAAVLSYSLEVLGLGAAVQNLLLAAGALGLHGVFIGDILVAEDAVRRRLSMTGDLVGVVAIGHSTSPPTRPKEPLPDRVRWHESDADGVGPG